MIGFTQVYYFLHGYAEPTHIQVYVIINYGSLYYQSRKYKYEITVYNLYTICGDRYFTDNYYTSVELMTKLQAKNTLSCGTVNLNRVGLPKDIKKTCLAVKKLKRGGSLKFLQMILNADEAFLLIVASD